MLLSPQAGCGNGTMSPPCLCVPAVLLGHHCTRRSVCKNTMAGLRDSMVGGWRRRQGNGAGEQMPFPPPAPFCEQRLLFLTKNPTRPLKTAVAAESGPLLSALGQSPGKEGMGGRMEKAARDGAGA